MDNPRVCRSVLNSSYKSNFNLKIATFLNWLFHRTSARCWPSIIFPTLSIGPSINKTAYRNDKGFLLLRDTHVLSLSLRFTCMGKNVRNSLVFSLKFPFEVSGLDGVGPDGVVFRAICEFRGRTTSDSRRREYKGELSMWNWIQVLDCPAEVHESFPSHRESIS